MSKSLPHKVNPLLGGLQQIQIQMPPQTNPENVGDMEDNQGMEAVQRVDERTENERKNVF